MYFWSDLMKDLQCKLLYLKIIKQTDSFKRKHSFWGYHPLPGMWHWNRTSTAQCLWAKEKGVLWEWQELVGCLRDLGVKITLCVPVKSCRSLNARSGLQFGPEDARAHQCSWIGFKFQILGARCTYIFTQMNAHVVQWTFPLLLVNTPITSPPQTEFGEGQWLYRKGGEKRGAVDAPVLVAKAFIPPGCLT